MAGEDEPDVVLAPPGVVGEDLQEKSPTAGAAGFVEQPGRRRRPLLEQGVLRDPPQFGRAQPIPPLRVPSPAPQNPPGPTAPWMAASMEALGMFFARHCSTTLANWALSAGSGPPSVGRGGWGGWGGGGVGGWGDPKSQRIYGGGCLWDRETLGELGGSVGQKDF